MGIPGLTTRLQKYQKRTDPRGLSKSTLLVDGPSLGYHICGQNVHANRLINQGVSYDEFAEDAKQVISILRSLSREVVFYFDGALPDEKRVVRMERAIKAVQNNHCVPVFSSQMLYEVAVADGECTVNIVPDEADNAIAAVVDSYDYPVVLSSDSDFFTYKFANPDTLLMSLQFCDILNTQLVCTNIRATRQAVEPKLMKPVPNSVPVSTIKSNLLRLHEMINGANPEMFFPGLKEDYSFEPAWDTGKLYRSYAYWRLFGSSNRQIHVIERYRENRRYSPHSLPVFDKQVYDYEEEIDPCVDTLDGVIDELVRLTCENEPASSHEPLVRRYYETVIKSPVLSSSSTAARLRNELIQVFAQIQACIHSMHILQGTGFQLSVNFTTQLVSWKQFAVLCCEQV